MSENSEKSPSWFPKEHSDSFNCLLFKTQSYSVHYQRKAANLRNKEDELSFLVIYVLLID